MKQCFAGMRTNQPSKNKRCVGAGFKTVIDTRCLYSLFRSENGSFNKSRVTTGVLRATFKRQYINT